MRFSRFLPFFAKFSAKAYSKFKTRESFCSRNYRKFSTRESFSIQVFQEFLALSGPANDDESNGDSEWEEDIESESDNVVFRHVGSTKNE